MAKNRFRQGFGTGVGAIAGIVHFALGNIYKNWFKLFIVFFIASFFMHPLMALAFTGVALGGLLAYKTILNYSSNVDSTNGQVVEHTPIVESIMYGCSITNRVAGRDSRVHSYVDRKVVEGSGYRVLSTGRSLKDKKMPLTQKVIDACDGISYSSSYKP